MGYRYYEDVTCMKCSANMEGKYIDESILDDLKAFHNDPENEWSQILNEKYRGFLDPEDFSHRLINHWEKEGILLTPRPQGYRWHTFSMMDMVWLSLVSKLRNFGMNLNQLRTARAHWQKDQDISEYFEYHITIALCLNTPTVFIVWASGQIQIAFRDYYLQILPEFTDPDHVIVSVNGILEELFPELMEDFHPTTDEPELELKAAETELLLKIRSGDFSEIVLQTNDGKITRMKSGQKFPAGTRIEDLKKMDAYQTIMIEMKDGRVRYLKRTVNEKFE